ncbi:MAG: hypothetical protein H7145_20440 [Akkermansiaceae bacterium]|nr:hypothetical protein [Armatimonadota bacterium]
MWLVCAATENELAVWDDGLFPHCERFVSGVGIPATFANLLPKVLGGDYSLLVNIGIAGAYPDSGLSIGKVVFARLERYADLGMELPEPPGYQALTETPFGGDYAEPFLLFQPRELLLGSDDVFAAAANGATVNTCTGTDETGHRRKYAFDAGFETMEGAAVAHVGQICGVAVCEIRAISNIAARRDMRPENIRLALRNLREYLEACARKQ